MAHDTATIRRQRIRRRLRYPGSDAPERRAGEDAGGEKGVGSRRGGRGGGKER